MSDEQRPAASDQGPATRALRELPAVAALLELPALRELEGEVGRPLLLLAVRRSVERVRQALLRGAAAPADLPGHSWEAEVRRALAELRQLAPRPLVNATGVVIHTNLGRAPLSGRAVAALGEAARGYTDLEYDLEHGERGSRHGHAAELLREVTGAQDALVVNNNAAAVLLATSALAAGGEVVVSRGELVEIGGSFRIPDVIAQGGARLVEVGTTNRTHLRDYERAIGPATRLLLKVHRSNFVQQGFTAEVERSALVALGRSRGLPVVEDLGSGCLLDLAAVGLPGEPTVQQAVAAGMGLVTFSGDKLVGGPQAGVLVGERELVDRLRHHPLLRALRPGKLTLAALTATLASYREGRALAELPVLRMLGTDAAKLQERAERFAGRLRAALGEGSAAQVELRRATAPPGGGSLPGRELPATLIVLRPGDPALPAHRLQALLRSQQPPIVARIVDGAVALDLRCVRDDEEPALLAGVCLALGARSGPGAMPRARESNLA